MRERKAAPLKKANIRLVQHCAAISAVAERLLFRLALINDWNLLPSFLLHGRLLLYVKHFTTNVKFHPISSNFHSKPRIHAVHLHSCVL